MRRQGQDRAGVTRSLSWILIALCAIVAAGGYFQVLHSPILWCGRIEAFPGTTILALICLGQTGLYLASAAAPNWAGPYRLSQIAVLPFVAIALFQVFQPHPRTVVLFAAIMAIPVALSLGPARWRWMRPHLPIICPFFTLSTLGCLAALGAIPLTLPGVVSPRWLIGLSALAAALVSIPVIGSIRPRLPATAFGLARHLPLALLLFPLLRAKLPDIAYDSTMYKTTVPYQMAEWLTGDTAIIDQFMVGTNLQEILNALLVVLASDYLPALISTIGFLILLPITSLAFSVERQSSPAGRGVVAFAGASAFVLTEAGLAQGTSHQEPLLLLFLVASLVRCPAWPGFLAIAIAIKINALFIAPLVLLYHILGYPLFWRSPRRLLSAALAAAIVLAPQINRNVIFSGRILGMNETLASLTDPPGPGQIMAPGETKYDAKVRGGILNNAAASACNMWLLGELCPTQYHGSDTAGFHVFPASRAPLYAVLFAMFVIVLPGSAGTDRIIGLVSAVAFVVGYLASLAFLSEARYFLPLSFGFPLLLLINRERAEALLRTVTATRRGDYFAAALGCWFVGSDLLPGTFTNVSWICRRELLTAARTLDLRHPDTPLQSFLVSYVDRYKRTCPPPGLPPVILAEHDVLNSPYLGTQRIFYLSTQQMIRRFFNADPTRQARSAAAIIAVVSQDPGYAANILGPAIKDFTPCYNDDTMHVICSVLLAPATGNCATSLYRP